VYVHYESSNSCKRYNKYESVWCVRIIEPGWGHLLACTLVLKQLQLNFVSQIGMQL
jgi:hypothetical protein